MTAATTTAEPAEGAKKRGFSLPSAYTILFILIVLVAILTWIIPAGIYDRNADGSPIPGTYHAVEQNPAIQRDAPAIRRFESGNRPQRHRLAGAGWTKQAQRRPVGRKFNCEMETPHFFFNRNFQ